MGKVSRISQISHHRKTFLLVHFYFFDWLMATVDSCYLVLVALKCRRRCYKHEEKGIRLLAENGPISQVLPLIVIKEANQAVVKTTKLQGKR